MKSTILVRQQSKTIDVAVLLILLVISSWSHFYRIASVPPGLGVDEAAAGLDALQTLSSGPRLYYPLQGGGGSLWVYFTSLLFLVTGPDPLAMRAMSGLFGIAAVLMTYLLGRELLLPIWGINCARWGAAVAAGWMGTSAWYLSNSRIAWPPATVPLILSSSFFFLWYGIRTRRRRRHFVASGLLLGLTWYTYLPARFAPLLLALFLGFDWIVAKRSQRESVWQAHRSDLLRLFVTALVVMTPIVIYYSLNPSDLMARGSEVSFLNPVISQGSAVTALMRGLGMTLAGFGLTLTGWTAPSFVLLLDRLTTACFLVGLVIALMHLREPRYLFLIVWWLVSLIPSLLAVGSFFHLLRRTVFAEPAVFLLASLCIMTAPQVIKRSLHLDRPGTSVALGLLSLIVLAWSGGQSYRTFFSDWRQNTSIQSLFNVAAVDLAKTMEQHKNKQGLYLLLDDSTSTSFPSERYVVEFLYNDPGSFLYLPDDERTLSGKLADKLADRASVSVIRWTADKGDADPKGYLDYLLNQWGSPGSTELFPDYTIANYQRTPWADSIAASTIQPADISFGDQLRLTGVTYGAGGNPANGSSVNAGEVIWTELMWERIAESGQDLQVALVIQDEDGHMIGRDDKLLLDNEGHRGTSYWSAGQVEHSYHVVSIMPAIPPGPYQLRIIVYNPADGQRLQPALAQAGGDLAAPVGEVVVKPPMEASSFATIDFPLVYEQPMAPGLLLLGSEPLPKQNLNPGDSLNLILYWKAENVLSQDYAVSLWLVRPGEETLMLMSPKSIGGPAYPTTLWRLGEVMRQWLDTYVPANLQGGRYDIGVRVVDLDQDRPVGEFSLGEVSIAARERQFAAPSIEHPVDVTLGDQIRLLGYNISFSANRTARLTLYWQAVKQIDKAYKVFVHIMDKKNHIWAQSDSPPAGGQAPTTGWLAGEVLADYHDLSLPDDTPSGVYTLLVGMYDPQTGHRLNVSGADTDAIRLTQVEIP